jgi:hypothetical protein
MTNNIDIPTSSLKPVGRKSVSFMKDPLLAVWGARNILAEARASSNAREISQKLAETEGIMFRLLLDLVRLTKKTGPQRNAPSGLSAYISS